jgi:hypothetical protein
VRVACGRRAFPTCRQPSAGSTLIGRLSCWPRSHQSAAPCEEIWGRRRKGVGWRNYDRDRRAVALCVILSCVE